MIETLVSMRTPHGNPAQFLCRPDTTDFLTVNACCAEDEYRIPDHQGAYGLTVAIDVGAHIGGATIPFALDNPECDIIAIEPLPENAAMLRQNAALNGVAERVHVYEGAAGKGNVTVFYGTDDSDFAHAHRFIGNADWQENGRSVTVRGYRLADFIATGGPPFGVTWLKIDCEGGEWAFLDDPLVREVAVIVGEWHPRHGYGAERLHELLDATHDVTIGEGAPGPFRAKRR